MQAYDENQDALAGAGKPGQNARRALGDIGNLGNGLSQKLHVGKDVAQVRSGVLTRRAAAQLAAAGVNPVPGNVQAHDSWGQKSRGSLRPRDANVPVLGHGPIDSLTEALGQVAGQAHVSAKKSKHSSKPTMPDIDAADRNDPLAATEFVQDIHAYYRRTEPKVRVAADYMSRQNDINDKMRAILVDWLVDVHLKFKLMPETLYLTTNLIDRFLEVKQVSRKHLQLVGVTAMLVASKYEEIWAPEVRDFVYISDRAYTRDQILNMEKIMLNALRFNLTVPTHFHFLQRFLKAAGIANNKDMVQHATYLVELALPEYSMLQYNYSQIAAAAVYVTNMAFDREALPFALARHSTYTEETLRPCAEALAALIVKAPNNSLTAVYKKFCNEKQLCVAKGLTAPAALLS